MSVFAGTRSISGVLVTIDGRPLDRALQVKTYGSGFFEWSYEGDGPLQLALAILVQYYGDQQQALSMTERFMKAIVANLDNDWELTSEDIRSALLQLNPMPTDVSMR
ncbi:MAG: hypothetical protein J0G36_21735 [Afipia sp.]|jgi:hypothetical protein|nr:hypothetical protein [Afipia sp.]